MAHTSLEAHQEKEAVRWATQGVATPPTLQTTSHCHVLSPSDSSMVVACGLPKYRPQNRPTCAIKGGGRLPFNTTHKE